MKRILTILICTAAATFAGCGEPEPDYAALIDQQVDKEWKERYRWTDANKFFSSGGIYTDSGDPMDQALDQAQVVPLLKRLETKHSLQWSAVVDKKNSKWAVAVVAEIPSKEGAREAILETLKTEQKTFPGSILVQPGNKWISLDFLNEKESADYAEGLVDKDE